MIDVKNLSKTFPDKKLFDNVNLRFTIGNTYGIIGANGAGKSTFLKIISGAMESTSGEVIIPANKRISVLSQDQTTFDDCRAIDAVIRGNKELFRILDAKTKIYENPDASASDYEKAAMLEEEYGAKGGWTAESDAEIILNGLGIDHTKNQHLVKDLKANEKVKIFVAQAIFGNPDILIMDEPTNYLDLKAIKWLEDFLASYPNLVILVSHDADFLDHVCTHIVDIDFGGAKMFTGNYTFWKESSQLAKELLSKQNAKKADQMQQLKNFIARFSANASKSSQATSRKKTLEKITLDEIKPSYRKYPFIQFDLNKEPGKDFIRVEDLSYVTPSGEMLFSRLSFSLHRGEKMALIGEDDIAKTKLFEILIGKIKPTTGKVIWGTTIKPDYFPADNRPFFSSDETLLNWISKWPLANQSKSNQDNSDSRMRAFLGRMFFSGDAVFKDIKACSGGEKARLMFSKMMLTESNFLLLNQPLDHLDAESIDSVIAALKKYKSGCIFATYNRTLVREAANVILELKADSSFIFRGTLREYDQKMNS